MPDPRATITVSAMARQIRASARRVAMALSPTALFGVAPGGIAEPTSTRQRLEEMSWADMAKIGLVKRIDKTVETMNVEDPASLERVLAVLKG